MECWHCGKEIGRADEHVVLDAIFTRDNITLCKECSDKLVRQCEECAAGKKDGR